MFIRGLLADMGSRKSVLEEHTGRAFFFLILGFGLAFVGFLFSHNSSKIPPLSNLNPMPNNFVSKTLGPAHHLFFLHTHHL